MTEPTRAQQEQVARELLGWVEPNQDSQLFQWKWHMGDTFDFLPAWNSPDFLWPLYLELTKRDYDFRIPFKVHPQQEAHAVWAAALAVTGEG